MMQVFSGVREGRNETILDILAVLSTTPSSATDLERTQDLGYATIWDNLQFLKQRNFVHIVEVKGRSIVYDITVKGALASIFSEHNLKPNEKTLEMWRKKDWGFGFRGISPFRDVNNLGELKEVIENMYTMSQITLEEISNEYLKKIITNPVDAINIFRDSKITLSRKIEESGNYIIELDKIPPGSSAILKTEKKGPLPFIISPDKNTQIKLKKIIEKDPIFERVIGSALLKTIQNLTSGYDLEKKLVSYQYNKDNNNFVIVGEFIDSISSYMKDPEQILQYTINSYNEIIDQFLENKDFIEGEKAYFTFRSLKYDPVTKTLNPLSKEDILSKAEKLLKQISNIKKEK